MKINEKEAGVGPFKQWQDDVKKANYFEARKRPKRTIPPPTSSFRFLLLERDLDRVADPGSSETETFFSSTTASTWTPLVSAASSAAAVTASAAFAASKLTEAGFGARGCGVSSGPTPTWCVTWLAELTQLSPANFFCVLVLGWREERKRQKTSVKKKVKTDTRQCPFSQAISGGVKIGKNHQKTLVHTHPFRVV